MINPYNREQDAIYEAKHRCMAVHGVIIMTFEQLKPILKYIKDKYGRGYIKKFKNRGGRNDSERLVE